MNRFFLTILIGFSVGILLSPLVIKLIKKLKANQTIYEYVDMHNKKSGTPTMGGIIFIVSIFVSCIFIFEENSSLSWVCLVVMIAYGILGFLDDYLKVHYKRNLGLRAYQKIIGQVAIATTVAIFAYNNNYVGTSIYLPFSLIEINLGFWFIPFTIFVFLSTTNSVNLTDGLDGLASGVSLAYLICFSVIFYILMFGQNILNFELINEQNNLLLVCAGAIGSLLAYFVHNSYPASVFMGDTGSLSLGGLIACLMIFTKQSLLIPVLGVMYVVSAVSVVIQVFYFKLTKKRVFLMAPYHHHLEKKGMYETKIVVIYIVITLIVGVGSILLTLLLS